MDEPCSALDPIATARIEELIDELRQNFTIVIVTHSMQQAARVSQRTAFFHLGDLVEVGDTDTIFTQPVDPAHGGLRHRPNRLTSADGRERPMERPRQTYLQGPSTKSCARLDNRLAEMGGMVEAQLATRRRGSPQARQYRTRRPDRRARQGHRRPRHRGNATFSASASWRCASPWSPRTCRTIFAAIRIAADLERIGDMAKNIAKRAHRDLSRFPPLATTVSASPPWRMSCRR